MTMHWALSRSSREDLRSLLEADVLLAFDFDGTLAPIVDDPERARMGGGTRRLLRRLAENRPCLVVSGRSPADLRRRLAGTGIRRIGGNHGAELWDHAPKARRQVSLWAAALAKTLPPGPRVENNQFSLTVHYRRFPRARPSVLKAVRLLRGVRVINGKEMVSLGPAKAPNKGTAVRMELARLGFRRALYVGDDETDEDVFALGDRILAVRVGWKAGSRARYFLRSQGEIDELLWLVGRNPVSRAYPAPTPRPRPVKELGAFFEGEFTEA